MKIIIVFVILIFTYVSESEEIYDALHPKKDEKRLLNNRVGLTYSILSGYGLTYLRQLDDKFSIKGQLFGFGKYESEPESYNENYLNLSVGAELQYNLIKHRTNRLYSLLGAYFVYDYNETSGWNSDYNSIYKYYNLGLGIGFESMLFSNITVAVDGGYFGQYVKYLSENGSSINTLRSNDIVFGFGIGVSLYYNF